MLTEVLNTIGSLSSGIVAGVLLGLALMVYTDPIVNKIVYEDLERLFRGRDDL